MHDIPFQLILLVGFTCCEIHLHKVYGKKDNIAKVLPKTSSPVTHNDKASEFVQSPEWAVFFHGFAQQRE
jgi:hypothetical protein